MHILLTVSSAFILCANVWVAIVVMRLEAGARDASVDVNKLYGKLTLERGRVTVLEREVSALRKWIQTLQGKFFAEKRVVEEKAEEEIETAHQQVSTAPYCEKYELAQREGPFSDAAKCDCNYCKGRRAAKEAFRDSQRKLGHLNPQWVRDHSTGTGNHGE